MWAATSAVASLAVAITAAWAQSPSESARLVSGEDFVTAFIGHCILNAGRTDKVQVAAEFLGYEALSKEAAVVLAPQVPNTRFFGWIVTEGVGAPYLLGISEGVVDRRTMQVCAVSNPFIRAHIVVNALRQALELRVPISDEFEAGQRYRVWRARSYGEHVLVLLMDAERMMNGGVTLSVMAPAAGKEE